MNCLIHPVCFPNIAHFVAMVNSDGLWFEVCDNYQKQTHRNRTEIYGANGKLSLTVPVSYSQKNRQLTKSVIIANDGLWQQHYLKSLQSAYSMSPFYEFYIDDLIPLFEKQFDYILDFNLATFEVIKDCLQLDISAMQTRFFEKNPNDKTDFRTLTQRNYSAEFLQPYTQVFSEKHGFISNLSILDLLFNEGPNTELYLKKQRL